VELCEERREGGDTAILRIEALDCVPYEAIIYDRCADIGERIGSAVFYSRQ
jgi:hypothetical protein